MKILKKIGWFLVAMLPALLSVILQFGCAFVMLFVFVMQEMSKITEAQGSVTFDSVMPVVYDIYLENAIYMVVLYHVVGILVFGIWYYFAYGRKKRPLDAEKPNAKKIAVVVFLGICIQVLISGILNLIYLINPDLLQNYIELMEAAGITELTLASFIATVVLAPVGEELLCRGIIFRIAGKASKRFWIANCIQALAFGLIHGNLVQGSYAFLIGIVLGYIYGKYQNIWICMLLHGVINCTSNFIDSYYELFSEKYAAYVLTGNVAVSLLLMIGCFWALGKVKIPEGIADRTKMMDNRIEM